MYPCTHVDGCANSKSMHRDLPDADVKPPDDVLFVCKLNPVTTEDDLEIIFSRFGPCRADICKDHITGE